MNDNEKDIEQLLGDLTFDDTPDLRHRNLLEKELLRDFNLHDSKTVSSRHNAKWRIVMNMKIAKLAAAAVLLIAAFVGFGLLDGTSSVSWAQVRDQVAAVKAVVYKAKVKATENGKPVQLQIEATLADEYGTRMDTYMGKQLVGRSFTLSDRKSQISIFPKQKKYIEVALTEENRIENGDPKLIVEAFLKGDHKELGRREINGVTAKGIQSDSVSPAAGFPGGRGLMEALKDRSSAKVRTSLWVDVATGWPVEITMDVTDKDGNEQMNIVVSDFQWDAQIDPATFGSIVPEGYTLMYKVDAQHLGEGKQLIDGLKYFAQINDGKYPAKLSVRDVVGEIGKIYGAKSGDPSFRIDDAKVSTLKYGAQYFQTLQNDGKNPVYHGPTVTANDANKVLLRWKLSDGKYRVIMGDLQIKDVDAAKLAQLEAQ
jgi:hypothetical protein